MLLPLFKSGLLSSYEVPVVSGIVAVAKMEVSTWPVPPMPP
jgi:hypothetical protein